MMTLGLLSHLGFQLSSRILVDPSSAYYSLYEKGKLAVRAVVGRV